MLTGSILVTSVSGGSSGPLKLGGFPFTNSASADTDFTTAVLVGKSSGFGTANPTSGYWRCGQTEAYLAYRSSTTDYSLSLGSHVTSSDEFYTTICYYTTA